MGEKRVFKHFHCRQQKDYVLKLSWKQLNKHYQKETLVWTMDILAYNSRKDL